MSATTLTPEAAPAAPAPSKAKVALHAAVSALISPEAKKLEFALARYVAYAVLAAVGVKHAGTIGF